MNDTPKEKAAAIRATLKYPDIETFVHRYAQNISKYGIFFKTSKPKPVGTSIKFELKIADGTRVLRGMGDVSWIRDEQSGDAPPGMGIKFQKLDKASRDTVKRVLMFKKSAGQQSPSRFSDAPPPTMDDTAAEEQARRDAEAQAKRDAEEQAKRDAEEQAKRDAEEQAKRDAEEQAKRDAEEQAKRDAEEQAKRDAEEQAKRDAEEQAKRDAEEQAKRDAEEQAKRDAEEQAKRDAEEQAKRDAEEQAKQKAQQEEDRKKRAREKLAEHQRSAAKIEADEDEIDEVVAAFDSIQMPGESDAPDAPAKADSQSPGAMANSLDADANIADSNLEQALFADEQPSETPDEPSSVADLIEDATPRESDVGNLQAENLFDDDGQMEGDGDFLESGDPLSFELPSEGATDQQKNASSEAAAALLDGDMSPEPLELKLPVSTTEESVSEEVEELSIADMVSESFEESEARSASSESYRVSKEPPLFSDSATPSQAPFEAEEFDIEEIDDVDFIEEIEDIESVEESGEVDEMGINFDNLESRRSAPPPIPPGGRFDSLVDTYSRGTKHPSSPPQPLWPDKTVDKELNNIFPPGGSTPPAPPAPPAPPSPLHSKAPTTPAPAPETLPEDALPDSLANFIERKSLLPTAHRPSSPGVDSQGPAAPHVPAGTPAQQAQQIPMQAGPLNPNAGMPGQQSPWGPPVSTAPPAPAAPAIANPQRPSQPQPNPTFNPNAGMPGQQSAWTTGPADDDDEFKKKGFFGKLFGK